MSDDYNPFEPEPVAPRVTIKGDSAGRWWLTINGKVSGPYADAGAAQDAATRYLSRTPQ